MIPRSSTSLRLLIVVAAPWSAACFGIPLPIASRVTTTGRLSSSSWDDDTEYPSFDDDDDDGDFPLDFGKQGLGIDLGSQMGPMSPEEIEELKQEAAEAIDVAFAGRLDEIADLKAEIRKDFEDGKKAMEFARQLNTQVESDKLMSKIDALSDTFLKSNEALRTSTKQAAAADRAMEASGQGVELGSWGTDEAGNTVTTGFVLGGSTGVFPPAGDEAVDADGNVLADADDPTSSSSSSPTKILVVVDESQDMDKKLVEKFTDLLRKSISEATDAKVALQVDTLSPSKPAPMGGLNARTAVLFTSPLSDRRSMETILDRILKRTAPVAGTISSPPTHLVCVSTVGTARTDKMPYSMQNWLGGRKLEKRCSMEEAVVSKVRRGGCYRPLDYTVVKFGTLVEETKAKPRDGDDTSISPVVSLEEGDSLDGDIGLDTAAHVLMQALALQPAARNVTLSATGGSGDAGNTVADVRREVWDDLFLRLDGPELYRVDVPLPPGETSDEAVRYRYERLKEYVQEWADAMFVKKTTGTGLTTPVVVETSRGSADSSGVRILFKQTATGASYKSKAEERASEGQQGGDVGAGGKKSQSAIPMARQKKEGGLEVIVEIIKALPGSDGEGMTRLRVRGRRCNMADDTVVKEISEGVLVKKLKKGVQFWIESQSSE